MRFSYCQAMVDPSFYAPLAQAAERAGYHSYLLPDSILYPRESDSSYPYNRDGSRSFLEGKPFIDPLSLIPALAAVTTRLRFATYVLKLPIRHPVLVAKQASSVAVLSGGRFSLGVGLSPWPEDYVACGQPWEGRGERMTEQLELIRGLMGGDYYEHHGRWYELPAAKICPVPPEPLPLLVGGNVDVALRRAARFDGWMQGGLDDDALPGRVARLHELRRELGREGEPFEVHAGSRLASTADGCRRLEEVGVTDVVVTPGRVYLEGEDPETVQDKVDALERYAEEVMARAGS